MDKVINKKRFEGVVVSDKMMSTVVVKVDRFVKHPKYGKFYTVSKKYKAHVAGEMPKVGSKVVIEECAPVAKTVAFRVVV